MCGIAVAVGWDGAEQAVQALIGRILYRGDVTDPLVAVSADTAFCTRRLRIVEAASNAQPAISWDGRMLVAFNGEIYNYLALRRELEGLGARFSNGGDAEVLAAALSIWGGSALKRLSGMYAFVALDRSSGEFLAARDPFGIKPLYFIRSPTGWLFCSEIRPLLETVADGDVLILPPGHFLTRKTIGRYSAAETGQSAEPPDAKALDRLLSQAVEAHTPRDLPVSAFFSGGLDSTLLVHYARQVRPDLAAYVLGEEGAPDLAFATRYAEATGLDLRLVPVDRSEQALEALLPDLIGRLETFEPEVVRDAYCNWLLSAAVKRNGYRVVLAGEGADELFAGYAPLEQGFATSEASGSDLRRQTLDQMGRTNLQRLDRCAMAHSVEARVPFLDPTVVQAALSYGGRDLVFADDGGLRGKQPLRALFALPSNDLPQDIAHRRKLGLNIGSGLDESVDQSPWRTLAEQSISDREFGRRAPASADYGVQTKEELLFLDILRAQLDVDRVPHLRYRSKLSTLHAPFDAARP